MPNSDLFKQEIEQILGRARTEGRESVDICSGDLHRSVGGYPSRNHRMVSCCQVMYSMMKPADLILEAPPKGKGASLKVRYFL